MEIEFNNVTYKENVNTPLEETYLRDISFKLDNNLIYGFIGDGNSGIDKIPLLINMIYKPTRGNVRVNVRVNGFLNDGGYIKNINKLRMNIGYVCKNPNDFLFNKTVKEELEFGLKYFKYKLNKRELRSIEALKMFGLDESYLNKRIDSLKLSDKKKISILSILIFNPSIIILEEPSLFLKYSDVLKLIKLIKLLKNKYNKTIIIITKDTNLVYQLCDRVYLFDKGSFKKSGSKDILTDSELLDSINVDTPDLVKFINKSNQYNANLTYTSNILDLIKEVYRNAK